MATMVLTSGGYPNSEPDLSLPVRHIESMPYREGGRKSNRIKIFYTNAR